jgi:hypothetical protein
VERKGARRGPLTVAVCALVGALLASTPTATQTPLEAVLRRVGAYTLTFVDRFSNVVAEEQYQREAERTAPRPRYRSDFLLVRYPGSEVTWMTFRDVREVNGRPRGNQEERLLKLFASPFGNAVQRAAEITRESSQFFGVWSNPLLALAFVQPYYQPRFRFSLAGRARDLGSNVIELKYQEVVEPTIIRGSDMRPNLRTSGSVWVDEGSGRIVKTLLVLGVAPNTTIVEVRFKPDEQLEVNVPVEMRESYITPFDGMVKGTATYGAFRRFQVQTSERLEAPGLRPTQ